MKVFQNQMAQQAATTTQQRHIPSASQLPLVSSTSMPDYQPPADHALAPALTDSASGLTIRQKNKICQIYGLRSSCEVNLPGSGCYSPKPPTFLSPTCSSVLWRFEFPTKKASRSPASLPIALQVRFTRKHFLYYDFDYHASKI